VNTGGGYGKTKRFRTVAKPVSIDRWGRTGQGKVGLLRKPSQSPTRPCPSCGDLRISLQITLMAVVYFFVSLRPPCAKTFNCTDRCRAPSAPRRTGPTSLRESGSRTPLFLPPSSPSQDAKGSRFVAPPSGVPWLRRRAIYRSLGSFLPLPVSTERTRAAPVASTSRQDWPLVDQT